jgi:Ser/Thr protein kinase RdoA (MazF antagonist)
MEVDDRRTPDDQLGAQLTAGRDATIHDAGPGRVLRRLPASRDLVRESRLMDHLHAAGYPVPVVVRVGPGEQMLGRVDGPTMLEDLVAHPWRVRAHARTLADLHRRLAVVEPPADLPPYAVEGDHVVHLDLHPGNVILSPGGPVVIDWPNARRGAAAADVAQTWLLLAAFDLDQEPPTGSWLRRLATRVERALTPRLRADLVRTFLRATGIEDEARQVLAAVADVRSTDPNVRPGEAAAIRRLVATEAR